MTTLDQVLETALQLSDEQQEMLIKILQNRLHESRRAEIAADAKQSLADFYAGKFPQQSDEDAILALRQSLNEPTESYLQERAKRGNRSKYEAVLAKVPDVEPE